MSGDRKGPRARDRIIGARLRALRRERTPLSLEQAAGQVQWSASTMSRTETGKRHISTEDVATICTIYKLPVEQREELIDSARNGSSAGWWDLAMPGVPMDMGALASYEADAIRLTDWSVSLVPGLLQTYHYAVALMYACGVPEGDIEARWTARQRRQQILCTLDYMAYIGEAVLRTPFGGREALREQIRHLINVRRRGIIVRVVPEYTPHMMLVHSWLLMEFPNTSPVINVEARSGCLFLHDGVAANYLETLHQLDKIALSASESAEKMKSILEEV